MRARKIYINSRRFWCFVRSVECAVGNWLRFDGFCWSLLSFVLLGWVSSSVLLEVLFIVLISCPLFLCYPWCYPITLVPFSRNPAFLLALQIMWEKFSASPSKTLFSHQTHTLNCLTRPPLIDNSSTTAQWARLRLTNWIFCRCSFRKCHACQIIESIILDCTPYHSMQSVRPVVGRTYIGAHRLGQHVGK